MGKNATLVRWHVKKVQLLNMFFSQIVGRQIGHSQKNSFEKSSSEVQVNPRGDRMKGARNGLFFRHFND